MKPTQIVYKISPESCSDNFDEGYIITLKLIQNGQYELASESDYLKSQNLETESSKILKLLLKFRLALKAHSIPLDGKHYLNYSNINDNRLLAEIHLINGTYFNNSKLYEKARESYNEAKLLFRQIQWHDKYLVASYNTLACEINLTDGLMEINHYNKLLLIQNEAEEFNNKKILGLICRQKSYFFKENLKWNAALSEAEKSASLLETVGFRSDYQFALLNLADCYFELNQHQNARATFEKIIPPIDSRVEFAYHFIESLISGDFRENKMSKLKPGKDADPHFLYRANYLCNKESSLSETPKKPIPIYTWGKYNGILKDSFHNWTIQPNSREYVLLTLLIEGAKSTDYLINVLWPLYAEKNQLENRLYSLISKVNKKFEGLIHRVNGKYEIYGKINFE